MSGDQPRKILTVPGTKLVNNTQLLISSGIPSLDNLIGGGLPVGSVLLIEEDTCGVHSKVMLRYFLAEGAINKHSLYVASQECDPQLFIITLPEVMEDTEEQPGKTSEDKLTIAWRYENIKSNEDKSVPTFGHYFDLTKTMDKEKIDKCDVTYWDGRNKFDPVAITFNNPAYHDLLQNIKEQIDKQKLSLTDTPEKQNIMRIVLHSLGSPLWLPDGENYLSQSRDLDSFLYCLRALARSAFVVVAVTIPSKLIDEKIVSRCIYSSDHAVRLEAFAGTELEKNPCLTNFHGFFKFTKFPAINTVKTCDPGPNDYGFKLRRKKFTIEYLHLPPDFGASSDEIPSMGCGSSNKHLLEF